jgi:hypothetical protein
VSRKEYSNDMVVDFREDEQLKTPSSQGRRKAVH